MEFLPDLITVVEWATVAVTFIMMASGLPVCLSMYKQRSTTNVPYLLFLVSALVSSLGLQYGILLHNNTLTLINVVAVLVWGTYVIVYILVSKSKTTPLIKLVAVIGIYSAHLYYLTTLSATDVIPTVGKYLLVWCTILCIVPAQEIVTMVEEKSTNCCDLPLLFGGTLNAGVWYLYGILVGDANIYLPNIPALFVSAVKFLLMFLYGLPAPKTTTKKLNNIKGRENILNNNVKNTKKTSDRVRQRK
jgi:uncharacterized protein with PQ loop repeat